jgi:predicted transcriptional regulator
MTRGKYYSIRDLANLTEQPRSTVANVLGFLANYGFVNRVGAKEPVFTRSTVEFSPGETINMLNCIANP